MVGVILAGGLSRRMQGPEKALLELAGKPLISHAADVLAKQVRIVLINANGDHARFAFTGLPVQADTVPGFAGPLAGVLAGMRWCEHNAKFATHVLTVAADTPLFPADLAQRFLAELAHVGAEERSTAICLAESGGNRHPVFGLWPVCLADDLEHFLVAEDQQKVMLFARRYRLVMVDFPFLDGEKTRIDPFFNINTPQDLEMAGGLIKTIMESVRP
jgi:molybdopterin-guanine dinucleotide biosynthesis protein A